MFTRYEQLRATATAEMIAEGASCKAIRFEQQADLKYGYQMYEMTLPLPESTDPSNLIAALTQLFTDAHDRMYGYHRNDPIELVSLRLRAFAPAGSISFADLAAERAKEATHGMALTKSSREAFFGPFHETMTTPLRNRFDITEAERGPLIIEEPDTTIVVPPGWTVRRDTLANLVLARV